ncbi:CNNM domain-containing protein [Planctomicrobium sp. SH668]|uniref:CNNM domain-containing protein n=1 Tax=Planctomicrobium sp. SH668 TaxID=3448126 RepID=UPI003F5C554F
MQNWMQFALSLVLLLVGIRMSAFFSGSETGFYRLSLPRLNIDARAGDKKAVKLLWFAQRPGYFVGTCLIGNNVSSYLCSGAVSSLIVFILGRSNETVEIASTLILAPILFIFGELLPKGVYYQIPYSSLKRELKWFRIIFFIFLPVTWPLMQLIRLIERFQGEVDQAPEIQLGRTRLMQLLQRGRSEGVLTEIQSRLANGLLHLAPQTVDTSMIPTARVLGVSDRASRKEMLEFARKFGVSSVAVFRNQDETKWYGYAFVAELLTTEGELPLIYSMPVFKNTTSKLEALHRLQVADASYGVVEHKGKTLGIVARNGLIEQLFRPQGRLGVQPARAAT